MTGPRVFQGSPLREIPLAWYERRYDDDTKQHRQRATEVAPGVFVRCLGWGDFIMPDKSVSAGARIAVWDERTSSHRITCPNCSARISSACRKCPWCKVTLKRAVEPSPVTSPSTLPVSSQEERQ